MPYGNSYNYLSPTTSPREEVLLLIVSLIQLRDGLFGVRDLFLLEKNEKWRFRGTLEEEVK